MVPYFRQYQLLELNQRGVEHLQLGETTKGLACFHTALVRLQTALGQAQQQESLLLRVPKNQPDTDTVTQTQQQESSSSPPRRRMYSVPLPRTSLSHTEDFLLVIDARALVLVEDAQVLTAATSQHEEDTWSTLLTGILVYDIALAHHWTGIQTGRSQQLQKALVLYQMAQTSLSPWSAPHSLPHNLPHNLPQDLYCWAQRTLLAVANNMAHVYAYFFQIPQVDQCLRDAGRHYSQIIANGDSNQQLCYEEHLVFLTNLHMFQSAMLTATPAA